MLKDLSAVDELARSHDNELPMMRAALEVYRRARDRGLLREDLAALYTLYSKPVP
jgi:3-hydroxyisobutyrate dehydrogenase-like beta-hydroxyacid dehydrogenase